MVEVEILLTKEELKLIETLAKEKGVPLEKFIKNILIEEAAKKEREHENKKNI